MIRVAVTTILISTLGWSVGYGQASRIETRAYNVVDLVYFDVKAVKNQTKLTWKTASEKNNDHFVIERSSDGQHFEWVMNVSGNGNSKRAKEYSAVDKHPVNGKAYYRLTQVDFDGKWLEFDVDTLSRHARFQSSFNSLNHRHSETGE